jgi:hypothetical protein
MSVNFGFDRSIPRDRVVHQTIELRPVVVARRPGCARCGAGLAWSTFGPHATGAERFPTVSSGTPFAQVGEAILGKQTRSRRPPVR